MALTVRLGAADEEALDTLTTLDRVSRQEAIVRAIRETAQRRLHEQAVDQASSQGRQRWASVLERLGQ